MSPAVAFVLGGTSPRATFSHSYRGLFGTFRGGKRLEVKRGHIPDRSPGFSHQSLMPATAGTPRYEKPELWFGTSELARRILLTPHPDPSGGQAPALHFLIPPSTIGLQFGTFRRWKAGIEVDWRAHFRTKTRRGAGGTSREAGIRGGRRGKRCAKKSRKLHTFGVRSILWGCHRI